MTSKIALLAPQTAPIAKQSEKTTTTNTDHAQGVAEVIHGITTFLRAIIASLNGRNNWGGGVPPRGSQSAPHGLAGRAKQTS